MERTCRCTSWPALRRMAVIKLPPNGIIMLNWAVAFLILAVIAALFGFSGIAGTAMNIAWILAVVGIVAAIAFFVLGRRPPL